MAPDDTDKLDLLKKQRAAFKGQLTYFKNQCSLATTLGSFESLLRRIQLVYDKYGSVQLRIESLDDASVSDRENFEDDYGKLEALILNKIHELKRPEDSVSAVSFQNNSIHEAADAINMSAGIRLPELKLPSFSGADSDWLAFRDVFVDLIHNKKIEATVKFVYLITHIRSGSAYALIENLPVTAENYETAWKSICDRYNNEVSIQRVHMREIYDVRMPQENSSKSLQFFIDHVVKHYNSLKSLKIKVEEWDLMLTHHITQQLDNSSRTDIIKGSKSNSILTFKELIIILKNRVQLLEALQANISRQPLRQQKDVKNHTSHFKRPTVLVTNSDSCRYCSGAHSIVICPLFNDDKLTPQMRFQFVRQHSLCSNCLIMTHSVRDCPNPPCKLCSLKHNIRLHFSNYRGSNGKAVHPPNQANSISTLSKLEQNSSIVNGLVNLMPNIRTSCHSSNNRVKQCFDQETKIKVVMIGTALVNCRTLNGNQLLCRALLDSGSHMNFVTNEACKILQVTKYPTTKTISGIGGKESTIRHKIYLTVSSRVSNYTVDLKFYVIAKIANDLPSSPVNFDLSSIPVDIRLADPYFNVPDRIDLLIGAEVYNHLFKGNFVNLIRELPPFYETELGYVVCGKAEVTSPRDQVPHSFVGLCSIQTLESQLKLFWEIENPPWESTYSSEEKLCEEHYSRTVKRLPCGRYSVSLPIKPEINKLGFSNQSSLRQFLALEKRLRSRHDIYQEYREFMSEYLTLGHMIPVIHASESKTYHLPHHYVLKASSTTTKLRVVFNASAKTSSQISLNDCLMVGPTIQQNIFIIMLRFRKHIYAFCADIAKMYRQIRLNDDQQDFQRIWWRNHPSNDMQLFKLCTVTYGTASAPFLATRTLKQLAKDEFDQYPVAARVLINDFYVDDVLTGCATLSATLNLKQELTSLLSLGGFELRKFCSNHPSLSSKENSLTPISLVLGISWNTTSDNFEMYVDKLSLSSHCSKRNMLSEICQLFDPLGLCAPIIITAKLFIQALWTIQSIGWDDPVPDQITRQWLNYKTELIELKQITLPRCILVSNGKRAQLHGFGDASEKAFGCVFYVRVTDESDQHHVNLLCAKSRVAPLKKQSIPRLELCAALLLAEMAKTLVNSLEITFDSIFLWSDSEVTLFRIKSEPHKYATFVANRIAKIQDYTSSNDWYYVSSTSNPADHVSRGLMPSEFLDATLWWSGPEYLYKHETEWPKSNIHQLNPDLMNLETRPTSLSVLTESKPWNIFERFHSLTKLLRVVAYMLRFYNAAKGKTRSYSSIELSPNEISYARNMLIKLVQSREFGDEIKCLATPNKAISPQSSLRSLSPFIDSDGILRVGGRLQNASIPYNEKHQILLPGSHMLSKLIVRHEHLRLLHAGPQALLYNIRLSYWIIGGRNLCRIHVNQCIRCFHARPHTINQVMGNLPADRVTKSERPFVIVGIDFCGPFFVKPSVRSKLIARTYVCLFICFTTKAVHLEVVMSLSTEAFLACLRRFIARRGICSKIYTDNATNFIGARSELRELKELVLSQHFQNDTTHYCTSQNIEWLTIPPRSPHFGGLWESAIKSAKFHMKRVIGKSSSLSLEEFHTLLAQVEACLNSRPITAMSSDPADLTALSPGHFIIGSPLTSLIEPSLLDLRTNRLSRFQLIQQHLQSLWKRWHIEYLAELQRRHKWQKGNQKFQIGSLVLLHEENLPPMNWCLGRIVETHPGKDGVVRVVSIKTAKSIFKRAVNRISVLPLDG